MNINVPIKGAGLNLRRGGVVGGKVGTSPSAIRLTPQPKKENLNAKAK
jgi:hypothetical protein